MGEARFEKLSRPAASRASLPFSGLSPAPGLRRASCGTLRRLPRAHRLRPRVPRLIDAELPAPRQHHAREQTPSQVLHRPASNVALSHFRGEGFHVVAHQVELDRVRADNHAGSPPFAATLSPNAIGSVIRLAPDSSGCRRDVPGLTVRRTPGKKGPRISRSPPPRLPATASRPPPALPP